MTSITTSHQSGCFPTDSVDRLATSRLGRSENWRPQVGLCSGPSGIASRWTRLIASGNGEQSGVEFHFGGGCRGGCGEHWKGRR
eukprot:553593-Rhodomonas_salina.1